MHRLGLSDGFARLRRVGRRLSGIAPAVVCLVVLAVLWAPREVGAQDAAPAPTPEPAPEGARFTLVEGVLYFGAGDARTAVALPGPALALQEVDGRAYVALGGLGAAVVSPPQEGGQGVAVVDKRVPVSHGDVVGFMVDGDSVWMQVNATSAIRLHGAGARSSGAPVVLHQPLPTVARVEPRARPPAAATAEAPAAAQPELPIKILKVFDGQVLLDRGASSGLRAGQRFKVVRSERVSDAGGEFQGERDVAVLVLDTLNAHSARARVWRGDEVRSGDRVVPADEGTDPSLVYPRQLHGFVEAQLHVRPILNVGEAGFGVLVQDHVTYYGEHFYAGLRNEPFAVGRTQGNTAFSATTLLEGGYNSRPFAIGLGAGFSAVYGDLQEMFELTSVSGTDRGAAESPDREGPRFGPWVQDMQRAFALGQRVRLGALDGLNLSVGNTLLYFSGRGAGDDDATGAGFIWGGTDTRLTIPLAQRADLFIEGGGGVTGYAYGAVGVFGWVSGNGGPGSLGLMASAGGAGVWGERTRDDLWFGGAETGQVVVGGPMVSLGLRYRAALLR